MAKGWTNKAGEDRADIYQRVTDSVVAAIEQGTRAGDWRTPWHGGADGQPTAMPINWTPTIAGARLLVFNAAQVEGYGTPVLPMVPEAARIAQAEAFFAAPGARVEHGGHRACYVPGKDVIRLPPFAAFRDTVPTMPPPRTSTSIERRWPANARATYRGGSVRKPTFRVQHLRRYRG